MSQTPLKILQIGAGSMGSRRLRDLSHRSDIQRAVLEARPDRRASAQDRFGVRAFGALDEALRWKPDALIISSPPDAHDQYVQLALELGLHHFSEANIWTPNVEWILSESQSKNLVSAPSNSLHFLEVVQQLRQIVAQDVGAIHTYQMSLSTYMLSWHPQEGQEYYARRRSTAAGREMVPFELLWLNKIFGEPASVSGRVTKRGNLPEVQEDVWSLQMQLQSGATGQLIVTMGSHPTCREGMCVGTNGIVRFDIMHGMIGRKLSDSSPMDWQTFGGTSNPTALERAYFDEINCFVDCVQRKARWPLDYRFSAVATATLAACEASAKSQRAEPVDLQFQPGIFPA